MTLTKRYAASALALAAMLGLSGCGSNDTATSEPSAKPDRALTEAITAYEKALEEEIYACEWTENMVAQSVIFENWASARGLSSEEASRVATDEQNKAVEKTKARLEYLRSLPDVNEETPLYTIENTTKQIHQDNDDTEICRADVWKQYLADADIDADSLRPENGGDK